MTPGDTHIRTPMELDAASRLIERLLRDSPSPRKRFHLIIDFYERVRDLPAAWLHSYLVLLIPSLEESVSHRGLDVCNPSKWSLCVELLERYALPGEQEKAVREQALIHVWKNAILSHAYAGILRKLESLLVEYHAIAQGLNAQQWQEVFASSGERFDLLAGFVQRLDLTSDVLRKALPLALQQWEEFRNAQHAVPIVLLESTLDSGGPIGSVQQLEIVAEGASRSHVHFRNELESSGSNTMRQLERAADIAGKLISEFHVKAPPDMEMHFRFHEYAASYTGESLGLGAALCLAAYYTQQMNSGEHWHYSPVTAAIGQLEADGSVSPASEDLIRQKIELAFFSPVEAIIIPGMHREYARLVASELTRAFPNRVLQLIGINHVREAVLNESGLRRERLYLGTRIRAYARKHRVLLVLLAVFALISATVFFAYQAYHNYPNLESSLGIKINTNAIVYNPRDTLEWCFRDEKTVQEPLVPFGDLEIGDAFTRNFWLWNMTPLEKPVLLHIDGPDSSAWFINWRPGRQTIPAEGSLRFSVAYNPLEAADAQQARLNVCDPETKEPYFSILLTGSSGPPLPGGYALRLDGEDDLLYFGEQSSAFDVDEATIECWIRPYRLPSGAIIFNGSNAEDKLAPCDLYFKVLSPDSVILYLGNTQTVFRLPEHTRIPVDAWTHAAITYSYVKGTCGLYINGTRVHFLDDGFLRDGKGSAYVTFGAWNDMQKTDDMYQGEIDEIRVWHIDRSQAEIRRDMYRALPHRTQHLAGYWNMDVNSAEAAFCATYTGHNGVPKHRPDLVRSSIPLLKSKDSVAVVPGPFQDEGLLLAQAHYFLSARSVLPIESDASISFWFNTTNTDVAQIFCYLNLDADVVISAKEIRITNAAIPYLLYERGTGWNHCVITRNIQGRCIVYINGRQLVSTTIAKFDNNLQRFEGLHLGFSSDKYQSFGPKYREKPFLYAKDKKAYAHLAVWSRILGNEEILRLYRENTMELDGLSAYWPLNRVPDENGNLFDKSRRYPLHLKRIRFWERGRGPMLGEPGARGF